MFKKDLQIWKAIMNWRELTVKSDHKQQSDVNRGPENSSRENIFFVDNGPVSPLID